MKKFLIIILFLLLGLFWLQILYIVPYSNYTITDQTKEIKIENYPELKEVSFMYSTDLLIEFYRKRDGLELEKIDLLFNNKIIGTIEINKNINDLEDFGETYIAENGEKVTIRKIYPLQKEFLRILGGNAEIYNSLGDGMFYLNIYIKDLKTNKIFVINRNNIFFEFESSGIKLYLPSI